MGVNPAIEWRLAPLVARGVRAEYVTTAAADPQIAATRDRLRTAAEVARLDASDASREEVIEWFRSLPIDHQTEVTILWPHDRAGARLRYDDFVTLYDDLWYPSADDAWVVDSGGEWVLELDHEEIFTLNVIV